MLPDLSSMALRTKLDMSPLRVVNVLMALSGEVLSRRMNPLPEDEAQSSPPPVNSMCWMS